MASSTFILVPKPPYRLDLTVWTLRRRAHNAIDRWDGHTYHRVLPLQSGPVDVSVMQIGTSEAPKLRVAAIGQPLRAALKAEISSALHRLLGLNVDLNPFYQFAASDRLLGDLAERFRGMKPPRFLSAFEAVINAIACQQLTLTVGIELLNRLAKQCGRQVCDGTDAAHGFPTPHDLASQSLPSLREIGFSQQKGRAIIELSNAIAEGSINLEELDSLPDKMACDRLMNLRGVGRWTAEYVLLRGLGRVHIFPGDDVGARNNLQKWLSMRTTLDYDGVRRTLNRWHPFGGIIYFHLLLDRLAEAGCVSVSTHKSRRSARTASTGLRSNERYQGTEV